MKLSKFTRGQRTCDGLVRLPKNKTRSHDWSIPLVSFTIDMWERDSRKMAREETRKSRSALAITFLIGLVVLAGLQVSSSWATAKRPGGSCGPTDARTLSGSQEIRVYEMVGKDSASSPSIFGCIKPSGRPRRLGPVVGHTWSAALSGPFSFATPWVGAIELRQEGQDTARLYSAAMSVKAGAASRCLIGGGDRPGQLPRVRETLLTQAGRLAWVALIPGEGSGSTLEIGACESSGPNILDSGSGININSVALKGSTLSWSDSGVQLSARLG
jgi:hypothetical protein